MYLTQHFFKKNLCLDKLLSGDRARECFNIWNVSSLLIRENKRGYPADIKDKATVTLGNGTG